MVELGEGTLLKKSTTSPPQTGADNHVYLEAADGCRKLELPSYLEYVQQHHLKPSPTNHQRHVCVFP